MSGGGSASRSLRSYGMSRAQAYRSATVRPSCRPRRDPLTLTERVHAARDARRRSVRPQTRPGSRQAAAAGKLADWQKVALSGCDNHGVTPAPPRRRYELTSVGKSALMSMSNWLATLSRTISPRMPDSPTSNTRIGSTPRDLRYGLLWAPLIVRPQRKLDRSFDLEMEGFGSSPSPRTAAPLESQTARRAARLSMRRFQKLAVFDTRVWRGVVSPLQSGQRRPHRAARAVAKEEVMWMGVLRHVSADAPQHEGDRAK